MVDLIPHSVAHLKAPFHAVYTAEEDEIVECYNVSGGYDYLLKIVTPGIPYFQALMDRLLEDEIGIEKFASRIVLRQPLDQRGYPLSIIATGKPSWD